VSTATELGAKDETIKSLQSQLAKLAAASKEQGEASRQEADDLRSRVATAQAEATKAKKGLEALKNEARVQAQTHARAHARALKAHAEVVRKIKHDNTALKQQVLALRQDKATLESQVAHLRPLATKAVRKAASLSKEKKKLMKEKDSLLREKLILQQVGASVRLFLELFWCCFGVIVALVLFWCYCCFGVVLVLLLFLVLFEPVSGLTNNQPLNSDHLLQ
jgi:chromosome segregation ATPase